MTTEPAGPAPAPAPAPAALEAALRAGGRLRAEGRFDEAAALFARAAALAPEDPGPKLELGRTLAAARRPEAARAAVEAAIALAPGFAPAWEAKARLLSDSGDWAGARLAFARAAALAPGAAEPLAGQASLALQAGDAEAARRFAEQALARAPGHAEAGWILARAELEAGRFAAAETRLGALLADPRTPEPAKSEALLALGEALHGQARGPEAFAAWTAGKAILRRLYAQRAASRPGETAKAQALTAALEALPAQLWAAPPAPAPAPAAGEAQTHVFLVGFPRSGTTLLEQALAGHPRVKTLEERPTLAEPIDAFLTRGGDGLERLARLAPDQAAAWRRRYWAGVRAEGIDPAGAVFVDKAPGETANLVLMGRLFPRAKFLFALRDPRDVVLSGLRHSFQMNALTYELTTLDGAAGCYGAVMAAAFAARARLPLDLIEVRHEALVADFEGGLRRVCAHLGLDWREGMADVAATARRRPVRTPSAAQVRAGVNARGVGGWRAYAAEMAPVLPVLEPWVARLGYG